MHTMAAAYAFGCCPDENGPKAPAEGKDPKNDLDCVDIDTRQTKASHTDTCELGQWGSWDTCHKGIQNRTRPVPRCLCDAFGCCPDENGANAPPEGTDLS